MRIHTLKRELWLARPVEEVFPFFADARNLEILTPPWLKFKIVTPGDIVMKTGTNIDYKLRVRGLPVRWTSEITVWEPNRRFVDEQRRGPYKLWRHEHLFSARDGGTVVEDRVDYAVPGGVLVHRLFVQNDVREIFDYRAEMLKKTFTARFEATESAESSEVKRGGRVQAGT